MLKDLFNVHDSFFSILIENIITGRTEIIHFTYSDLVTGSYQKKAKPYSGREYVTCGANLNGHRLPRKDLSGLPLQETIEYIRKAMLDSQYLPDFYILGGFFQNANGQYSFRICRCSDSCPYVYTRRPLSYEYNSYRLVEERDKVTAIRLTDVSNSPRTVVLTQESVENIKRVIKEKSYMTYTF